MSGYVIDKATDEWKAKRAGQSGEHIQASELTVAEIERGSPFGDGCRDEVSLSEARKIGEREAACYPSKIALNESQHAATFLPAHETFYP